MINLIGLRSQIEQEIKNQGMSFLLSQVKGKYIWISDNTGYIGGWPCHYEICADEFDNTSLAQNPAHKQDTAYIEIHIEGNNAPLKSALITKLQNNNNALYEFDSGKGYHGFRRIAAQSGFSQSSPNFIYDIIQELNTLDSQFGCDLKTILRTNL